ncbi:MAG: DUF1071 domain-containing protein [Rhodocyclaceae bacterium]|nr:DUF1071 domain-containing protein [Rhodocyclaceae bacterium]MBX3678023.1 DUF1071 domain-containing protein [Rhodocyclaceae bacterium]MCO5098743.1 DUF1071 domain-containing protein [Rhodocyclaceae bacterium]
MQEANAFRRLFEIDVAKYVEKKGQFSYLSWPYAVAQLRLADPAASWEVKRFAGLPYLVTELGVFVEVAVTVQGVTLSQIHPVLDAKNRPILAPTSFDINSSIQRCLVKAIALHGLGLAIYAGEDLPLVDGEPLPAKTPAKVATFAPQEKQGDAITPAQVRYIERLIEEAGTERQKVLDYFGIAQLEDIAKSEASRVIRSLEQARNRKEAA